MTEDSSDPQASLLKAESSLDKTASPGTVTVGPEEEESIERHKYTQPEFSRRSDDGYVTLYSLTAQPLRQTMPHVYYDLRNPPLEIEFDVIPPEITREKWILYNNQTYDHPGHLEAIVPITRPSDLTWAEVIVRNRDSGQIVESDGFGKTYSLESPREIIIRKPGNYDFEFNGDFGTINLTMKAPREGNVPE